MEYIKTINYFEKLISGSINHNYLKRYIDKPVYEKHHILALYELTKNTEQYEQLIHTTMLVHLALNTHDKIKADFQSKKHIKKQQLTVLAGDYFSGVYYATLAEHNNLPFIRLLAIGIHELTQLKMKVFYHQYEDIDSFLDDYIHLQTGLTSKVAQYTGQEDTVNHLTNWIMLKHIEQEISYLYKGQESFFQQLLTNNVSIERSFNSMKRILWQLHSYFKKELDDQTNHFPALRTNLDLYHITELLKDKACSLEEGLQK